MQRRGTIDVVREICASQNVDPAVVFGVLLGWLAETHGHFAGFAGGNAGANVFSEIESMLNWSNPPAEPPPSILATLRLGISVHQSATAHNANLNPETPQAKSLASQAAVEAVLVRILQEVMNDSERRGIETRLAFEKRNPDVRPPDKSA